MNLPRYFSKILSLLLLLPVQLQAANPPKPGPNVIKDAEHWFRFDGSEAVNDRAVGLADKGQLSNLFSNYGILSDFHMGTPALHWQKNGGDVQHYGFGVDLIVVADGKVVTSIYDPSSSNLNFGWEAMDGALGSEFNSTRSEFNTAGDGVTPFQATSDLRATWPVTGAQSFWPGWFRTNLQNPALTVPNEFTSDRDIFCTIRDDYNMGLKVEQTAYSYGRPYAEDFIFVRYRLINNGTTSYDSCYIGFQTDLKPDFYADDYIQDWAIAPYDTTPSFFYKWDGNGIAQRTDSSYFGDLWNGPVGYIGMGLVETPDSLGVTSFHYYHDDNSPVDENYFAALLANNPNAPLEDMGRYFHGSNPASDDPLLWYQVDNDSLPGSEITFTCGSGPFSLAVGDSVSFGIVIAVGADSTDLRQNVEMAYYMAKDRYYQGSGPPAVPQLNAVAGDGQVRLYWDNLAEASIDAISGLADFEGYRVYKSLDQGMTWGNPITNYYGDPIGWIPVAQFDLKDSVTGLDPNYGPNFPNANRWLGDDTGLSHAYTDNNVSNGQAVWYCVTAYDRGVYNTEDSTLNEPSYENALGTSIYDINLAVVTPGTQALNLQPGSSSLLTEMSGKSADGQLEIIITETSELLSHEYRITFNDKGNTVIVGADTVIADTLTLNLEDLTDNSFYFTNQLTGEGFYYQNILLSGDDLPIVNGFRLYAKNVDKPGLRSAGWTSVQTDSSTFDWWTENRHPGVSNSYEEVVEGLDDWRITITADSVLVPMIAAGFGGSDSSWWVPLKIERLDYNTGLWVDATLYLQLSDLRMAFPTLLSLGPFGWELIPGGKGYNPDPNWGTMWPDMLLLRDDNNDTTGSQVWLKTQNGPDSAKAPNIGDVFSIWTYKPFTSNLIYEFSTAAQVIENTGSDLSRIKVVPNPLIVSSGLETNPYESKVMFTHLPTKCDIAIYTVSGNRVTTLHHDSPSGDGFRYWDLLNHEGQNVAYGLYIYVVKTPEGASHTGKMMVIR